MPRRFHKKSKNGCNQCKERRVKCDETRPICSACTARELPCIYSTPHPRRGSPNEATPKPNAKPPAMPVLISPKYDARHLLLMHKFSTETYKSICGDQSDMEGWQILIPKLAFEHEFLLHGIFSIAALHMAATATDREQVLTYLDTALQCNNLAFAPFREALAHLTPVNCDAAFAQSAVVTIIGIALPRLNAQYRGESCSMIETMMAVFELLQGASKISQISKPWRKPSIFFKYDWRENTVLDPDMANAIAQLRMLNSLNENTDPAQHRINQEAIDSLQDSFAKFTHAPHPAPIIAWLTYANREFVDGLRTRQPFQLFILMNWAVLLNELGARFWWAKDCGKALVAELLSELKGQNEKWESALQWPQQMVGM
ncbi:hypothetical protein N7522_003028 [Penicillium canescens]|nr:hypothetical protein N7522_003028 [Penicillium canescens]